MKPEDLQLGDIVATIPSGMPIKVAAIHRKKVAYHACTDRFSWVRIGLLQPIPLTPEILEKIGFKFEQQGSLEVAILKMKNHHPITLEYIGWSDGRWSIREHRLVVKYVHELQHALRLCGIDKEINI